jgi:hypothetical protein
LQGDTADVFFILGAREDMAGTLGISLKEIVIYEREQLVGYLD